MSTLRNVGGVGRVQGGRRNGLHPHLSLYMFEGCPYCERVRVAIRDLDLPIEERDIRAEPAHASTLIEALGRSTVPVLRVDEEGGATRWLPESSDIVRYLYDTWGEGRRPPLLATSFPQTLGAAVAVVCFLLSIVIEGPARLVLLVSAAVIFAVRNSLPLLARR